MNHLVRNKALKIVAIYLLIGFLWIFLSDSYIELLSSNAEQLTTFQNYKGVFFVSVTGFILYGLISGYFRKIGEANRQYELLFQDSPIPMWIYDVNTLQILQANKAACQAHGLKPAEILSKTMMDFLSPEGKDRLHSTIDSLPDNQHFSGVWAHVMPDKSLKHMEIISFPFLFEGRKSRLVFAKDITKQVFAEKNLEEKNSLLEKHIGQIQSYSYANSHRVRAPLANILGLVDLLIDENDTSLIPLVKESAIKLNEEVSEMNKILSMNEPSLPD
ncbi:MAG: PAS domain S-box protein [Bacteroidia bacterium]|nr:PAS domain S-box protein [Bacteroidia bacterium]